MESVVESGIDSGIDQLGGSFPVIRCLGVGVSVVFIILFSIRSILNFHHFSNVSVIILLVRQWLIDR